MKMNFSILKKGKPIYWIIGGIVLFVIFYMVASKGAGASSSGGGSVTTISPGPSDAQVAAGVALQTATIQANSQMAQINAAAQVQMNQNQTDYEIAKLAAANENTATLAATDIAKYTATLDAQTQSQYLTTQQNLMELQGEYSVTTAKVAAQNSVDLATIQGKMWTDQLAANASMFKDQLAASTNQALIAQIPGLDYRSRTHAFAQVNATINNVGLDYTSDGQHTYLLPAPTGA